MSFNNWVWTYLYYNSPQSVSDSTDTPNTSTYDEAEYLARPAGNWGGVGSSQMNMVQGPTNGNEQANNNYGSDYFMDAFGYLEGYAPTVAPTEPVTYGAGAWVNGTYVAQPLPSTDWPNREPV
jgi:hypothetical protein